MQINKYFIVVFLILSIEGYAQKFIDKDLIYIAQYLDSLSKQNPEKTFQLLKEEVKCESYNDTVMLYLWYYKGNSCFMLGDNVVADLSLYNALDIATKLSLNREKAAIYQSLGVLYDGMSDFEKSDSCSDLALKLYQLEADTGGVVDIYINKGSIDIERKKYDSALNFLFKALKLSNNDDQIIMIYNNIGEVYLLLKEYEKAKKHYLNAYLYCSKCEQFRLQATLNINLADLYFQQGKLDSARVMIEKALQLIDLHSYFVLKPSALQVYAGILKEQGELDLSYDIYVQYVQLDDSINNTENANKFYRIEKNRLIKNQKEKLNFLKESYRVWDIKLYASLIILSIIISGAIFYNVRQIRKLKDSKKKVIEESQKNSLLQKEIKYKDKELENFAHHISLKNKFLNDLKLSVKEGDIGKEELKLIDKNLNLEKNSKEFYLDIDKLQANFFLKLKELNQNLTERDMQLAALLVVGMSSKEISDVLFISDEGVKKARYRLRKKLNLAKNDNLMEYLKKM